MRVSCWREQSTSPSQHSRKIWNFLILLDKNEMSPKLTRNFENVAIDSWQLFISLIIVWAVIPSEGKKKLPDHNASGIWTIDLIGLSLSRQLNEITDQRAEAAFFPRPQSNYFSPLQTRYNLHLAVNYLTMNDHHQLQSIQPVWIASRHSDWKLQKLQNWNSFIDPASAFCDFLLLCYSTRVKTIESSIKW